MATTNFLVIPARSDLPWYNIKLSLNNIIYTARFRFNKRSQRWILDIADAAGNDILNGIVLLVSRNLTGQYVISGLPPGVLFVASDTGSEQPSRYSFASDKTLFYKETI